MWRKLAVVLTILFLLPVFTASQREDVGVSHHVTATVDRENANYTLEEKVRLVCRQRNIGEFCMGDMNFFQALFSAAAIKYGKIGLYEDFLAFFTDYEPRKNGAGQIL